VTLDPEARSTAGRAAPDVAVAPAGRPERVMLVAPPFSGHLHPITAIALRLREIGMSVHIVTGPSRLPELTALDLPCSPILAHDPTALERIADTPKPVGGNPFRLGRQLRANLDVLPEALAELEAIVAAERPEVIVADFTAPIAGLVAQTRGIPWITTMPTPFALETRTGTPSYCGGWGPARHTGHRVRDAAGRAVTHAVKTSFGVIFRRRLSALGTSVYRADGSEAAYSPTMILGLGLPELEFERDWPAALRLVGPITTDLPAPGALGAEADPRVRRLLDSPRRTVLVTLGTHLQWAKTTLLDQVCRLAADTPQVAFLVSLGRRTLGSGVPAGLDPICEVTERVVVCDYLSYDAVLPHVDAVIHHGGAGISYAALAAATPALVWPHDYDQFDFAARLTHAGVALRVRSLTHPSTAEALRRALDGLDPTALARLQAAVTASDPLGAAESAVRAALRH
jgi:UDP:flavonoid glycosyltransferase YjiC (YdhE family)